jgi:hypothetical protein
MDKKEKEAIIFNCFDYGIPVVCNGKMYRQLEDKQFCRASCQKGFFLGYVPTSKALAISAMVDHLTDQDYLFYKTEYNIIKMFVDGGMNPYRYNHRHEGEYLSELELAA